MVRKSLAPVSDVDALHGGGPWAIRCSRTCTAKKKGVVQHGVFGESHETWSSRPRARSLGKRPDGCLGTGVDRRTSGHFGPRRHDGQRRCPLTGPVVRACLASQWTWWPTGAAVCRPAKGRVAPLGFLRSSHSPRHASTPLLRVRPGARGIEHVGYCAPVPGSFRVRSERSGPGRAALSGPRALGSDRSFAESERDNFGIGEAGGRDPRPRQSWRGHLPRLKYRPEMFRHAPSSP